ncbi:hypothetical protein BTO06_17570 [Tenacibaculum sp. SZ-18]|uniref:hypothetical protein n=1 Tax=Tenacibaculum sp. SZ-18 TaxID=754423 RepID=UPI000C2CF2BA|nr:hypothetical protein [Tenacibaculum sp. SZ-18]AUC16842.1 hypothetical protein BTO06_17570 [Tenacibaculum sp. SZ-18]
MKESAVLYDEVLKLNICDLKKWGYLQKDFPRKGIVSWSKRGVVIASIKVLSISNQFISLSYNYKGNKVNLKVFLAFLPSNLGKGEVCYFVCPETNKRCRKLYLINGKFLHREAFSGVMYESQIQSKKLRFFKKEFENHFKLEKYYAEVYRKYFKPCYNGKETKRYKKLRNYIENGESISIERLNQFLRL